MKPIKDEFRIALDEAERIRDADEDLNHIAKCLLYLHQRNGDLEQILAHLEKYLRFGLPVEEHSVLIRLVDGIKEGSRAPDDSKGFGL
ncbi:MAG: hypothetical protein GY814_12065 [Gammaproteobacteria bacterium]|nr:hypothetical protein [Gammaproteobacteria bacterium]